MEPEFICWEYILEEKGIQVGNGRRLLITRDGCGADNDLWFLFVVYSLRRVVFSLDLLSV